MTTVQRGALTALLLPALLAGAQTAGAQQLPERLTLEDALRIARTNNPTFRKTENDLELASNAVRAAWAAFLPTLNPSINFSGSRGSVVTGQDDFGNPVRLPEALESRSSSTSQSLSIGSVTLFDGGSTLRGIRERRANYTAAEAQIDQQEIQLVGQVSREFYQAVRAASTITLEERLLASSRERLARTEELMRLAARNRVDVLGARADVAQGEQNLERARGEAEKARLTLAATLGLPPNTTLQLDSTLPDVFNPADLDVERIVTRALQLSPSIRRAEVAITASSHRAAAARGGRWPRITANVSYGRSMSLRSYDAFGQFNPQNSSFGFGVGATLPLFNRFQTSNQIAEAEAAVTDARHDLQAARLTVEREIRAAIIDLTNAYRSLQLAIQRAELSREREELAQEQYRLGGSITFTELQNLLDRTAEAERQALDARFAFITAQLALEERLGARLED